MKAGGLFTAIGVLAVLGGLVWWSNKHPSTDAKSNTPAAPKLISVDAKQIDDIRIVKSGSEPIELAKLADSWEIAKPMPMHADQDAVNMMTSTLSTLNADRLIDEHPADLNEFGLTNPAVEVDFTLKGGKTAEASDRQRYAGRHRHLRQAGERSEGLHHTYLYQELFRQNSERPAG